MSDNQKWLVARILQITGAASDKEAMLADAIEHYECEEIRRLGTIIDSLKRKLKKME